MRSIRTGIGSAMSSLTEPELNRGDRSLGFFSQVGCTAEEYIVYRQSNALEACEVRQVAGTKSIEILYVWCTL